MTTQSTFKYTFVDTESSRDRELFAANLKVHSLYENKRIGSRIINAAALFDVEIAMDGAVSFGAVKSWSQCSHKTDLAVTKALFDSLLERSDRVAVTWGGVPADQQILTLTAMDYGLVLPPHFQERTFATRHRMHLDLSLAMKGSGKTWHHLSEVAIRLGVPIALLRDKARFFPTRNPAEWRLLTGHCELDTLITAIVMIAWRIAQGTPGLRFEPAVIATIGAFLRQRPDHPLVAELKTYAAELEDIISDDRQAA